MLLKRFLNAVIETQISEPEPISGQAPVFNGFCF